MSPTTCPTCGKVVDPLRARSVGVRDGKVVAYCSAPCAAAAESRPVSVRVSTPAAGVAFLIPTSADSGPVIEIIREGSVPTARTPATGVPTTAASPAPSGPTTLGAPTTKSGGEIKPAKASAPRRDHTPTPGELAQRKQALAAAEESDDDAMINGDDAPARRKLPVLWVAVIVLVLGGGVVFAIKMMSKSGTAHAASMTTPFAAPGLSNTYAVAARPPLPPLTAALASANDTAAVQAGPARGPYVRVANALQTRD